MVTREEYKRVTAELWKTVKVKTHCVMRNDVIEIPIGTVCTILGKGGGFTLKTEPCKCCGVSIFIRKVAPEHVRVWDEL